MMWLPLPAVICQLSTNLHHIYTAKIREYKLFWVFIIEEIPTSSFTMTEHVYLVEICWPLPVRSVGVMPLLTVVLFCTPIIISVLHFQTSQYYPCRQRQSYNQCLYKNSTLYKKKKYI